MARPVIILALECETLSTITSARYTHPPLRITTEKKTRAFLSWNSLQEMAMLHTETLTHPIYIYIHIQNTNLSLGQQQHTATIPHR